MSTIRTIVVLVSLLGFSGIRADYTAQINLDTTGGIKNGLSCSLIIDRKPGAPEITEIRCNDGTVYRNVRYQDGSPTGTPPWLEYSNYIGSYTYERSVLPGGGKRRMFFDGQPRVKQQ